MKGLAEHQSGNKLVGFELAKKGLKFDVANSIANHVMGIIYRNDRAFHQARKYFEIAVYLDPKNERLIRDLSSVQLQLRDFEGHLKTRRSLWKNRPDLRVTWLGYALALHLCGDYEFAHHLVKLVQETALSDTDLPTNKWEIQNQHSELLLYQNFILRDAVSSKTTDDELAKAFQAAIDDLESSRPKILDKIALREAEAELHLKSKKLDLAKEKYLALIDTNPDNITYHYGLLTALTSNQGITLESIFTRNLNSTGTPVKTSTAQNISSLISASLKAELSSVYADLQKKHPKSLIIQQMPLLHWLDGEAFKTSFGDYARPLLTKGVPSLWNSVKSLYAYPAHVNMIDSWAREVVASLEKDHKFPGASKEEDPTTLLWAYYFLALHECKSGEFEAALKTIEKAITHTPTVMDVYLVKGKILSKAGDAQGAAEAVEQARTMDLADRNLNTLSVKYWCKAGNPSKAQTNMAMFTKLDNSHYGNVFTLQVMWFETLRGDAHLSSIPSSSSAAPKENHLALAMKNYHNIVDHFYEWNEDQYDFINYAMRYWTFTAYTRLIRMEDRLPGHVHYVKASKGLLKCYLRLDDIQQKAAFSPASFAYNDFAPTPSETALSAATASASDAAPVAGEGKKKAPPPKKKAGDAAAASTATSTTSTKAWNSKFDSDPNGEQLAKTQFPLRRAAVYAQHLAAHAWEDAETHALLVEYYVRTAQFTLALRSVNQLLSLAPAHPATIRAVVRLVAAWTNPATKKTSSDAIKTIIDGQIAKVLGGKSLEAFVDAQAASASSYTAKVAGTYLFLRYRSIRMLEWRRVIKRPTILRWTFLPLYPIARPLTTQNRKPAVNPRV